MFGLGRHDDDGERVRRILIVEDEPLVAFDNEHILHEAGYIVVATVDSAADAARLIGLGGIDLVLADVGLRGPEDGIAVARTAHAAGIAVIFVTGGCPPDARRFAVGCLAKPYTGRDLLAAIGLVSAKLAGRRLPRRPRGFTLFED
ncbi:MAG TPA: response regulator [Sphingomonas sp.]